MSLPPNKVDFEVFRGLLCIQILGGLGMIHNFIPIEMKIEKDLTNTIKNGRPIGSIKDRFYNRLIKELSSAKCQDTYTPDALRESVIESLKQMRNLFERIEYSNPIENHSKLHQIDLNDMKQLLQDTESSNRRLIELKGMNRPGLMLPIVKDRFNLSFEKGYKPAQRHLMEVFKTDGVNNPYQTVEKLLSLKITYGDGKDTKSDVRTIRNHLMHPENIDRYDHYAILIDGKEQNLTSDNLFELSTIIYEKSMMVCALIDIVRGLTMYTQMCG